MDCVTRIRASISLGATRIQVRSIRAILNPMTSFPSQSPQSIQYSTRVMKRATRAVKCSPFRLPLFQVMQTEGVSLKAIAGNTGVNHRYTHRPLTELVAENQLMWLIQTGLLRREVDGQGLTDSFRLTPLGRQLVVRWKARDGHSMSATWLDQLLNATARWFQITNFFR